MDNLKEPVLTSSDILGTEPKPLVLDQGPDGSLYSPLVSPKDNRSEQINQYMHENHPEFFAHRNKETGLTDATGKPLVQTFKESINA